MIVHDPLSGAAFNCSPPDTRAKARAYFSHDPLSGADLDKTSFRTFADLTSDTASFLTSQGPT